MANKMEIGKRYLIRSHPGASEIMAVTVNQFSPSGNYAEVGYGGFWVDCGKALVLEELPNPEPEKVELRKFVDTTAADDGVAPTPVAPTPVAPTPVAPTPVENNPAAADAAKN